MRKGLGFFKIFEQSLIILEQSLINKSRCKRIEANVSFCDFFSFIFKEKLVQYEFKTKRGSVCDVDQSY